MGDMDQNKQTFAINDRVFDKFKRPKPGDMQTTGTVLRTDHPDGDQVWVRWDSGLIRECWTPVAVLEKVDG